MTSSGGGHGGGQGGGQGGGSPRRSRIVELTTILISLAALAVSGYTLIEQRQLSDASVNSARLQSIYERSLDVDRLLTDKPEIAQIVFQADSKSAAEIYVLDYDQYVWNNIRQLIRPGGADSEYPDRLALKQPPADNTPGLNAQYADWEAWSKHVGSPIPQMSGWSDKQWEEWTTWSETIAGGFRPSIDEKAKTAISSDLCRQLNDGRQAYGSDFVAAIVSTRLCPVDVLPPNP